MRTNNNTASTERPRSTDPIQVIMTLALLPNLDGRALLVSETPINSRRFSAIQNQGGTDQSFVIIDPHGNNCILPGELAWVRYDEDAGGYIPIGSTGLVREARSEEMQDAGEVMLLLPLSDTPITATSDFDLEADEVYLTTYLQGTREVQGSDHLSGYWRVFGTADPDSNSDDDSNDASDDSDDGSDGSGDDSGEMCVQIPGLNVDLLEDVFIRTGDKALILRDGCWFLGNVKPCREDEDE